MSGKSSGTCNKDKTGGRSARRCQGKNKDGSQCRGRALSGADFCTFHSPSRRVQAKVRKGRLAGGRIPRAKLLEKELEEITDLKGLERMLNKVLRDLYSRRLEPKQGGVIIQTLSGLKSTFEARGDPGRPGSPVVILPANSREFVDPEPTASFPSKDIDPLCLPFDGEKNRVTTTTTTIYPHLSKKARHRGVQRVKDRRIKRTSQALGKWNNAVPHGGD
jgi:hypothetical protein